MRVRRTPISVLLPQSMFIELSNNSIKMYRGISETIRYAVDKFLWEREESNACDSFNRDRQIKI
jgi:hypothetical protein